MNPLIGLLVLLKFRDVRSVVFYVLGAAVIWFCIILAGIR